MNLRRIVPQQNQKQYLFFVYFTCLSHNFLCIQNSNHHDKTLYVIKNSMNSKRVLTIFTCLYSFLFISICNPILNCLPIRDQKPKMTIMNTPFDRHLSSGNQELHNFRITANFSSSQLINIDILKKKFQIAARYYYQVIKVRQLDFDYIKYPDQDGNGQQNCSSVVIPSQYITQGFNPNVTDFLIIPSIYSDDSQPVVAFTSECYIRGWVVYAGMTFNSYFFGDLVNDQFHRHAVIIMHEIGHDLGMNSDLFEKFYKSLARAQIKPIEEVRTSNANGKLMIITPNVLEYVQTFFNCHDNITGALLKHTDQQQDIYSSHWQDGVFNDELMNPYSLSQGIRVTQLTLNLFKDSNYYDFVDVGKSWKSFYGKGKGCDFANGVSSPQPEFCTLSTPDPSCDISHSFSGYCQLQSAAYGIKPIITPYAPGTCRFPSRQEFQFRNQVFSGSSSCIKTDQDALCYQTKCNSDNKILIITINGTQYICNATNQTIYVSILKQNIQCPNIQVLCANQGCTDWCAKQGICINGACIGSIFLCQIDNCSKCIGTQCQLCNEGFYLNDNKSCSQCVKNCQKCSGSENCTICFQGYFYNNTINQCDLCNSTCLTCQGQSMNCTSCDPNSNYPILNDTECVLNYCSSGQYYDSSSLTCLACDSNCLTCSRISTNCTSCVQNSSQPLLKENKCISCLMSQFYEAGICNDCQLGCLLCQSISNCTTCIEHHYLNQNNTCQQCNQNCLTCQFTRFNCTSCIQSKFFNQTQRTCENCDQNCLTCQGLPTNCTSCNDSFFFNETTFECEQCDCEKCPTHTGCLHNFRITPSYQIELASDLNSFSYKIAIEQAIKYYSNIIRVRQIDLKNITYNSFDKDLCSQYMPSKYQIDGYDPNQTDMLLVVTQEYNTDGQWRIVQGISCPFSVKQWPTYGLLVLNSYQFTQSTDIQNQLNVIILHQLTHILGLSYNYDIYYNQVQQVENGQMAKSLNVLKYVQEFFGCEDNTTGALLQWNQINDFDIHWNTNIYPNELMNDGVINNQLLITGLTLNFLKDTGFYDEVNTTSQSWPSEGYHSGCQFAKGNVQCNPNCLQCNSNDPNNCTICKNGYFLEGCCTCKKCDSICLNCQGTSSNCLCQNGKFWNVSTTECQNCDSNCLTCQGQSMNCTSCDPDSDYPMLNNTECVSCDLGFLFSNISLLCEPCDQRCKACQIQSTFCTSCDQASLFPSFVNNSCLSCQSNQFFSTSSKLCLSCDLSCKACQVISTNCTQCYPNAQNINNKCIQFISTLGLPGSCQQSSNNISSIELCQFGCQQCTCNSSNTQCITPSIGYFLLGSKPTKCQTNCLECQNKLKCKKCINGYYLLSDQCAKCTDSCIACDQTGCQNCLEGLFVDQNNLCSTCSVSHCSQCSSNGTCQTCQDGYSFIEQLNVCQQCPSYCTYCSKTDISVCEGCGFGYYLSNNECLNCIQNCYQCGNGTACLKCNAGYTTNAKGICKLNCEFPCAFCLQNQPTSCTGCFAGYLKQEQTNKCVQDLSYDSGVCPVGYQPDNNNSSCVACQTANCASCQSDTQPQICTFCLFGYYLGENNNCQQCPTGCSLCINSGYCSQCKSGYTRLVNKQGKQSPLCYACEYPCATCRKNIKKCSTCVSGFTLFSNKCVSDENIGATYTLDVEYKEFVKSGANTRSFRNGFLNSLGQSDQLETITIKRIYEGSVVIETTFANPSVSTTNLCSSKSAIESTSSPGSTLGGFKVLSSSFQTSANCNSVNTNNPSSKQANERNLALILGITIPLSIILFTIFVCLIGFLIFKLRQSSPQNEMNEANRITAMNELNDVNGINNEFNEQSAIQMRKSQNQQHFQTIHIEDEKPLNN